MPLTFNLRHLDDEDLELTGQLPLSELELDGLDDLIHPGPALDYDLIVQKIEDAILAQGRLEITLNCECSRCLKLFKHNVLLENWAVHLALKGDEKITLNNDCVDLTPYIREDILLEFPQHPLCKPDCAELPNRGKTSAKKASKTSPAPKATDWTELDKLKF